MSELLKQANESIEEEKRLATELLSKEDIINLGLTLGLLQHVEEKDGLKRKYIRVRPTSSFSPAIYPQTEKRMKVLRHFAATAIENTGKSVYEIRQAVKDAFKDWKKEKHQNWLTGEVTKQQMDKLKQNIDKLIEILR